jgi:predicted Rossmann fold nucleotide-binding protein DprA/Smf involved in DNA uptake
MTLSSIFLLSRDLAYRSASHLQQIFCLNLITQDYFDEAAAHDLILREVSVSPIAIDEIVRTCHLTSAVVQGTLLEMELNGLVQRLPGNRVCLLQAA